MERINRKQVIALAEELGKRYPAAPLDLQQLDVAAGQAWRLYVLADYPTTHGRSDFPGLSDGFLGSTNREAYQTLTGILAGMEAQRLAQAETIRFARQRLDRQRPMQSGQAAALDARAVEGLDALAPATEF